MRGLRQKEELIQLVSAWRGNAERIAIVPTMGSLHEGHLSLVRLAQRNADRVVVTSFVNPTQFGEGEDFSVYPRSLEQDTIVLQEVGADVLFAPEVATVYPFGINDATRVSVPVLTEEFCGASRPGHFDGVVSVVMRLFAVVQPHVAVFGQKDYQQLLVIRRLVDDLGLPISILAGPIVREADGLAMSSRNQNLSNDDRQTAAKLYQQLQHAGQEIQAGNRHYGVMERRAKSSLSDSGMDPEYFSIRQFTDLRMPGPQCRKWVILAAASLGKVRLIDNFTIPSQ